ncbi:hypothetical protein Pcinc_032780 [Petrolisthes cinctipes]|uniref:Uncharacterized protein n=1 Tax=Petrolisthes cinctipes TaxID=88211 RepID=A0AAE1ETL7_PETCI|nr:hypothetical protein Pcinc_032780 [Petrolisthes cinctipes]
MDVLSSLQPLAQMAYCDPRDQPPAVKSGDIKELDLPFIMRGDILGRGKGTLSLSIEKIKRWRRSGSRAVISRPSQDGWLMSSEVGVNCHLGIRHRLE